MHWFLKTSFSSDCLESSPSLDYVSNAHYYQLAQIPLAFNLGCAVQESGECFPQAKWDFPTTLVVTGYTYLLALLTNATKSQRNMQNESCRPPGQR